MACNCGSSKKNATKNWVHTAPNGKTTTYSSEMDARLAASREGGKVTPA